MKTLEIPTHTADYSQFNYTPEQIWGKSSHLTILIAGQVKVLRTRFCRPCMFDGSGDVEIKFSEAYSLIAKASRVVGWVGLAHNHYQNCLLKG